MAWRRPLLPACMPALQGGYGILASSSNKTDLRVYSTSGR